MVRTKAQSAEIPLFPQKGPWDIFLSYATEDYEKTVMPLAYRMVRAGIGSIWWDRQATAAGDSIPSGIGAGLLSHRYLLAVITKNYLKKHWPRKEFDTTAMRNTKIIPVWCGVTRPEVEEFRPWLATIKAIRYSAKLQIACVEDIAEILIADKSTDFARQTGTRDFLRFLLIDSALGYVSSVVVRNDGYVNTIKSTIASGENPMSWKDWKAVLSNALQTNDAEVRAIYKNLEFLKADVRIQATVLALKLRRKGWAPLMPGDDELVLAMTAARGRNGYTTITDPYRELFLADNPLEPPPKG